MKPENWYQIHDLMWESGMEESGIMSLMNRLNHPEEFEPREDYFHILDFVEEISDEIRDRIYSLADGPKTDRLPVDTDPNMKSIPVVEKKDGDDGFFQENTCALKRPGVFVPGTIQPRDPV